MRILFYGTKPYDKIWFEPLAADYGYEITFLDIQCTDHTIIFSKGYDAICVFINDTIHVKVTIKDKYPSPKHAGKGFVVENVQVFNQHDQLCLTADHLLLCEMKG